MNGSLICERIEVTGVVQGVGFRPFVYRIAADLGLSGQVGNRASVVFIDVSGTAAALDEFSRRLCAEAPPLARIACVTRSTISNPPPACSGPFSIAASEQDSGNRTHVPPDATICQQCVEELSDPANRRFAHPFITCTNCGPRFTIIRDLPYDRPFTTMDTFAMCGDCATEYGNPLDRRYHAQPISCHDCGPTLRLQSVTTELAQEIPPGSAIDPRDTSRQVLDRARRILSEGGVLAVKGTGGFQLACDATNAAAIQTLRERKRRPDKPFAVMVASVEKARRLAHINAIEEEQLRSVAAPIVLLEARSSSPLSSLVAPGNPLVGIMLASTPVHHLLLGGGVGVLVLTSGNPSGTPIIHRDEDIGELESLADAVLTHDREIHVPCDDSVIRVVGEELLPVRRARGYAPIPLTMTHARRRVLAVGAELKNTFCLVGGSGHAWISQHIGDMGNLETMNAFEALVDQYQSMYEVELDSQSDLIVADKHPGYLSTRWAERASEIRGVPLLKVQHHHAHVCAVMAEHQLDPATRVIGFAFDGTGFGDDGSIWGGEVLLADGQHFDRVASLTPVELPGNDAAARTPFRSAYAHLCASRIARSAELAPVASLEQSERDLLERQLASGFGCITTTSMGRLFDAVASLLGLRQEISFEAQAAIELEILAGQILVGSEVELSGGYHFGLDTDQEAGRMMIDQAVVVSALVDDIIGGADPPTMAWRFHRGVADMIVDVSLAMSDRVGSIPVVLSGGVFQNALLASMCTDALHRAGLQCLTHRLVPANDGGLALGQAYIGAAQPQQLH